MTERNENSQEIKFSGIVEIDIDQEASKEETNLAWENLFVTLTSLAKTKNEPVDENSISVIMQLQDEDGGQKCIFRVVPALVSPKGDLEVVVLDIVIPGKSPQMWIARAQWNEGKPKITTHKPFRSRTALPKFTSYAVATYAEGIVRILETTSPEEPATNNTAIAMSMPPISPRSHHRIN